MRRTPAYVDGESYWYGDWSTLRVHRVSARRRGGKYSRLGAVRAPIERIPELREHWAATTVVALTAKDAREEQAGMDGEELGDYVQ